MFESFASDSESKVREYFVNFIYVKRTNFLKVEGEISYGGFSSKKFDEFHGEAIYIPEEDLHYPTLTVEQTLDFALRMKTPGEEFTGNSRDDVRKQVRQALLKIFALERVAKSVLSLEPLILLPVSWK